MDRNGISFNIFLFSFLSLLFSLYSFLFSLISVFSHRFLSLTFVPLTDASQSLSPSEAVTVADLSHSSTRLAAVNIFNHHRSRLATLDLTDLTHCLTFSSHGRSHPKAVVDLTLFLLLSIHLSLCLSLVVGFLFFIFFAAIWVDLILVSNCGGWFAVEVGCSGGDGEF